MKTQTQTQTRVAVALLALSVPGVASGYVRSTTANTTCPQPAHPLAWDLRTIGYVIDSVGSADVSLDALVAAVNASFQTWQDVSCASIGFAYGGTVNLPATGNVVSWVESDWASRTMTESSTAAITITTFFCNGQIMDADILVNGEDWQWSTDGAQDKADIQSVITHEAGHFVGFAHSPDPQSTMYFQTRVGDQAPRTLTTDDAQGACDVYPQAAGTPDAAVSVGTADAPIAGTADASVAGTPDARPAGTADAAAQGGGEASPSGCSLIGAGGSGGVAALPAILLALGRLARRRGRWHLH